MRALLLLALIACTREADPPPPPRVETPAAPAPAPKPAEPVDVVSKASPKREEGPKVVTASGVDGDGLRAKHKERLAHDDSPVTVLTGADARTLGRRLCEAVVPARPLDTPVLLKPNLGGFDWFRDPKKTHGDDGVKGRITDPDFVRGVIDCLQARGMTKLAIADGFTGKPADWRRLARVSGYEAMAKAAGVPLYALDDDGVFDVEGDAPGRPLGVNGIGKTHVPTLLVPKLVAEVLDHGLFITLPKLKAHRFAVVSLGIKGMQGTTMYSDASPAFHQKWRSHRELDRVLAAMKRGDADARKQYVAALEAFAERMVDVLEVEAPDVELAEGAPAMGGDGFEHLVPTAESVAIGGTNVIAVDRVGAQYLGLWDNAALARELGGHRTSPLIEVAAKRFGVDLAKVKLAGDGAGLLGGKRPAHLLAMAGFEIDERAGTGEMHAARIDDDQAPAIDGAIDEVWAKATPLVFDTDWRGNHTKAPTRVRALWSSTGLYVLWELDATGLNTDQARPIDVERKDLYEEDCVELFLTPDPAQRDRYLEIEVGPFGHFYDLSVDRAAKTHDDAWSSHPRIATHRAGNKAIIEAVFEAPEIVGALGSGVALPIGLYRMEAKELYLAAFPTHTPKPNFHVPSAFGTLVLDH